MREVLQLVARVEKYSKALGRQFTGLLGGITCLAQAQLQHGYTQWRDAVAQLGLGRQHFVTQGHAGIGIEFLGKRRRVFLQPAH